MPSHEDCRLPLINRAPPGTTGWPTLNGDDPPPSLQLHYRAFITTTRPYYYEALRPSPAHRYFRPRGGSRSRLFPWHRRPGSHVPYKSLALQKPGPTKAWSSFAPPTCPMPSGQPSGPPPDQSRRKGHPPVSTSSNPLSTLRRWFACARLSQPCLPGSSSRRFRNAHHHGF